MNPKAAAYLQLMRFPNVFTAMADVLAGCLIVSGLGFHLPDLLLLLLCSSCIYTAGCVLNDLCDLDVDLKERPFRPLPSKRISTREAFLLMILLFGVGIVSALAVGPSSLFLASLLTASAVSYNTITKNDELIGPINMGACRSLNLILGMSTTVPFSALSLLFPLLTLIYVFTLTRLSRFEVDGAMGKRRWSIAAGWGLVVSLVSVLSLYRNPGLSSILFPGLLALYTGPALLRAFLDPTPLNNGQAVKALIIAIPILDAAYVSAIHDPTYGIPVAFCLAPSLYLARYLYVT